MFSRRDTLKISLALSAMGLSTAPAFAWKTGELEEKFPVTFSSLVPVSRVQLPLFKPLKTV